MHHFVKHLLKDEDGQEYAFFTLGNKANQTIIILPGMTGTHEDLYPIGHCLQNKHFIIIPDFPGWGASQKMNKPSTIQNYTHFVNSILESQGISQTIVVGHCMGSIIAIKLALLHPKRVKALFLLSPPYENNSLIFKILKHTGELSLHLPKMLRPLFYIWRNRLTSFIVAVLMANFRTFRKKVRFASRTFDRSGEIESVVEENSISAYEFNWNHVRKLSQPIHIIQGKKDFIVPLSEVKILMNMMPSRTTLDIMDHAGHLLILEEPGTLSTIINKYL